MRFQMTGTVQSNFAAESFASARDLLLSDPDVSKIRAGLYKFNFFEAIGAQRRELRHSDFLAFMLDPKESHGLGDVFLRGFLKCALKFDGKSGQFDRLQVQREFYGIDILLLDDANRMAVIIENKVDTGEHDNQLRRYWDEINRQNPGYKIFGIYLTREGEECSAESRVMYRPMSYSDVCNLIDDLLITSHKCELEVAVFLNHYVSMLRRHIVPNSEIEKLCRDVYLRHRKVLETIFEHRPDERSFVRQKVQELVNSRKELLTLDTRGSTRYIRFAAREWERFAALKEGGAGWSGEGRILLFEFQNEEDSLKLKLIIGPGPSRTRQRLLNLALAGNPPLRAASKILHENWNEIYAKTLLKTPDFDESISVEDRDARIEFEWKRFLDDDLPRILEILRSEDWAVERK